MPKNIPIILAAAALLLVSCAEEEQPKPPEKLPERFSVNAVIHDGELEASTLLTRSPEGWEAVFSSPERLAGVRFEITDIECMASFGDLHYPISAETMLVSSPLLLTVKALDGCVRGSDTGTVSGQSYTLSYKDGAPDTVTVGTVTAELADLQREQAIPS